MFRARLVFFVNGGEDWLMMLTVNASDTLK